MKKYVVLLSLLYPYMLHAQERDEVAAWLLPGISRNVSPKVDLLGEAGYSPYYKAGIGYIQGFITVHKHLVLNPGYLFFYNQGSGPEHFLMNAVTGQFAKGNFFTDDRNMLWNRISNYTSPQHYYRNRLRLVRSFQLKPAPVKVYVYNEAFYLLNAGQWRRNRLAAGCSYDVLHHLNMDITYIRQWDRYGGWLHLFFIMGTWKL